MSPKPFAALAAELASAGDVETAFRLVNDELASAERGTGMVLLNVDPRRNAIVNRALAAGSDGSPPPHALLALDHLPPNVQYVVVAGQRFADVGDQASQYARLVGVEPTTLELRLFMKGIVLEGTLAAVIATYDSRRRAGNKVLERAEPLATLFELAYARFFERDARFEAVDALHAVTGRMRGEHSSIVAAMERELERLRAAERAGTSESMRRLREAVAAAERRAVEAEDRLVAVEGQVVNAVDRLERAHVQLHQQDALVRALQAALRELQLQQAQRDQAQPQAKHDAERAPVPENAA